jgi:phosphatidylserine/phosphatidylglycerophosphate/cardiolipin synthase-like enzyme
VTLGKVTVTPFFTTGTGEIENVETGILAALKGAKKVRIAAMLISDPNILETLFAFSKPGSDIKGVVDPGEMKVVMHPPHGNSKIDPKYFWFANGDKRFVAAPSKPFHAGDTNDFMHNKLMIIDDETVITGSYNFSENAESNDENLLVIKSTEVAAAYSAYFDRLFTQYTKHGAPLPPK